jgi:predicted DNA binding CopG/RHH family protein
MLNQCILVGKVIGIKKDEEVAVMTLSIKRNYKEDGEKEYATDEVDIELSDHLKRTALEYLSEDATVGVKARIVSIPITIANKEIKLHKIIAEKLTFINTKKSEK